MPQAYTLVGRDRVKAQADIKAQPIRPTLLIGLGGTGGDVLLRVRRKFQERFGDLSRFPTVGYLYIDTDVSAQAVTQVSHGIEEKGLGFEPNERVEAMITKSNPLYVGKSLEKFPHIAKWLDPQIPMPENIVKGAGQIRGLSRLAFFHNFQRINERIQGLSQTITTSTSLDKVRSIGYDVSPQPVQVYVVCSIAGGTGSGMFLDMAYLVSHLIADTERRAYLVFPDIFKGKVDMPRVRANGCAALMELEHYNRRDSTFKVRWQAGAQEFSFAYPPFQYCYLIEGQNMSGPGAPPAEEMLEIMADNIFANFSDPIFSGIKDGVRVNLEQYTSLQYNAEEQDSHGAKVYTARHTCQYYSFGIAKVGLSMDRIVNACSCKLAADIVDYWGNLSGGTASLPADRTAFAFERFLHPAGLVEGTHSIQGKTVKRNDIFNAMISSGSAGKTLKTDIAEWSNQVSDRVNRGLNQSLYKFLKEEYDHGVFNFRNLEQDRDPGSWGNHTKRIVQNYNQFLEGQMGKFDTLGRRLERGAIDKQVSAIVNNEFFGPKNTVEILREVVRILRDDYGPAMQSARAVQEKKLQAQGLRVMGRLTEIQEIEAWPELDWRRSQGLRIALGKFLEEVRAYFETVAVKLSLHYGAQACEEIRQHLSDKVVPELDGLEGNIRGFWQKFDEQRQYYAKRLPNTLVVEPYEEKDIELIYYPGVMGDKDEARKVSIKKKAEQLLPELVGVADIAELPQAIERLGPQKFQKQMFESLRGEFKDLPQKFGALEVFSGRYKDAGEQKRLIQRLVEFSSAWIRPTRALEGFELLGKMFLVGIGHPKGAGPEYTRLEEQFKNLVSTNSGDAMPIFRETSDPTLIVFYREIAGFPLCFSDTPRADLQPAYDQAPACGYPFLHVDARRHVFDDIVPLAPDEWKPYREATRLFLLGVILGKVQVKYRVTDQEENLGLSTFRFYEKAKPQSIPHELGVEKSAIGAIFGNRQTMRSTLQAEVDSALAETDPVRVYSLCAWYIDRKYPLYSPVEVLGTTECNVGSTQYMILQEECDEIWRRLGLSVDELRKKEGDLLGLTPDELEAVHTSQRGSIPEEKYDAISVLLDGGWRVLKAVP